MDIASIKTDLIKNCNFIIDEYLGLTEKYTLENNNLNKTILELVNQNNYTNTLEKVHGLIYDSVEMKTICIGLHDTIIKTDMASTEKFKLLRVVGEAEWRSSNMTPKVLASWMVGQMI